MIKDAMTSFAGLGHLTDRQQLILPWHFDKRSASMIKKGRAFLLIHFNEVLGKARFL